MSRPTISESNRPMNGLRVCAQLTAMLLTIVLAAAGASGLLGGPDRSIEGPVAPPRPTELSTTFVGPLVRDENGRLAGSWNGDTSAAELDARVDFNADGLWSDERERIGAGPSLTEGIEVFEFDVPPGATIDGCTRTRLRIGEVAAAAGASRARELPRAVVAGMKTPAGCGWASGFEISDLDRKVRALEVYDDGSGAALYAGGDFTTAGGEPVGRIARWDGTAWSALTGPSGTGIGDNELWPQVEALVAYDDGSGEALFVGGDFTEAGGVTVNNIAKWDGTAWSALTGPSGTGTGPVHALAVYDDGSGEALYAGGSLSTAGGVTVNNIAKWDGTAWSALSGPSGNGTNGDVYALAVYDDGSETALYAGGYFNTAGGVTVNNIAKWDGTAWSALSGPSGTGTNSQVEALAVHDDGSGKALYAGGWFFTAGGLTVSTIAKWDGTAWSALSGPASTGTNLKVEALAVHDDGSGEALYAGGWFSTAGGVPANHIAKWDGTAWSALSGPSGNGTNDDVYALAAYDDGSGEALYAGGDFYSAGGEAVHSIATWDGTAWSALSGPSGNGTHNFVEALAAYDDGTGEALYVGGRFGTAGAVIVNHVAKWDGTAWSALSGPSGTGTDRVVEAFAVHDDGSGEALYVGGNFFSAGGVSVNNIAKWDGTAWSALSGLDGGVHALAVYDDGSGKALYAGGWFTNAGGVTVNSIAKWDGTAWSALSGPSGTGTDGTLYALAVYDDGSGEALYAGGLVLATAGGVTVNSIARWDGTAWSALSGPFGADNSVFALAVYDDGSGEALYAGGWLATAGGVTVNNIAKWDGTVWSALSGPSGTGTDGGVWALAVYHDGSGSALYAGGTFATAGGVTVNGIAKWDGTAWSALSGPSGTGTPGGVYALAAYDDSTEMALYAGGGLYAAGGVPSSRIAKWSCGPYTIFADGFESGDTQRWSRTVP